MCLRPTVKVKRVILDVWLPHVRRLSGKVRESE